MVNRLIALNTKHFSDKQNNNRGYAETQTGEQLDKLLRQEWLRRDVADIRAGKEEKRTGCHLSALTTQPSRTTIGRRTASFPRPSPL